MNNFLARILLNKEEILINIYNPTNQTIRKIKKNDSIFSEDNHCILFIDGAILNSADLIKITKTNHLPEAILSLYKKNGPEFIKKLNGSFRVFLYDKNKKQCFAFTNRIGDKRFYYFQKNKEEFLISSSIPLLVNLLKTESSTELPLNIEAAYQLLTYGFLLKDNTLIYGVNRLIPGHYIKITPDNGLVITQYYSIPKEDKKLCDYPEAVEKIDELFNKSIELEYEKDKKFGKEHFVTMSGGLDSRMSGFVAHKLGYKNLKFFTFSQSNYLDHTIASDIAKDLDAEFLFVPLDKGRFINQQTLSDAVRYLGGHTSFLGGGHTASSFFSIVKANQYNGGLIHTGQLGDVVIGNYSKNNESEPPKKMAGAGSVFLQDRLQQDIHLLYDSNEAFMFYNRGFNGILGCNEYFQQYGESTSPFLENDFFDFCMQLPLKYKAHHKIYIDWILAKHRGAAKYKWENINNYIDKPRIIFRKKLIAVNQFPRFLINEVKKRIFPPKKSVSDFSMNPFEYWNQTNPKIKEFIHYTFNKNIYLIKNKDLKKDCIDLFENGRLTEQGQILTLLETIKEFNLE